MTTPLTNQQMFDNALLGIRRQGYQRSYNNGTGSCVYYNGDADNGAKLCCAVGHSIPEPENLPEHINTGAIASLIQWQNLKTLLSINEDLFVHSETMRHEFLHQLQRVHDLMGNVDVDGFDKGIESTGDTGVGNSHDFEAAMQKLAAKWELTYTPV